MSSDCHESRASGRSRYRLVASLSPGDEITRDGFDDLGSAQSAVAEFVRSLAMRAAHLASLRMECCPPGANGTAGGNGRADAAVIKQWGPETIYRILRQAGLDGIAAGVPGDGGEEKSETAAPFSRAGSAVETPDGDEATGRTASPLQPSGSPEAGAPNRAAANQASPVGAAASSRPRHRRTRWDLIVAIVLVVVVAGGILFFDTNGNPLHLLTARHDESVRDTLPFRQVRPPHSTTAPAPSTTRPAMP
ncbi:MAG: hypothetical protein HZB38_17185 [Planctomycetes bacterium]|nr:hypothetical protein [Planctomycetota bacterium]